MEQFEFTVSAKTFSGRQGAPKHSNLAIPFLLFGVHIIIKLIKGIILDYFPSFFHRFGNYHNNLEMIMPKIGANQKNIKCTKEEI